MSEMNHSSSSSSESTESDISTEGLVELAEALEDSENEQWEVEELLRTMIGARSNPVQSLQTTYTSPLDITLYHTGDSRSPRLCLCMTVLPPRRDNYNIACRCTPAMATIATNLENVYRNNIIDNGYESDIDSDEESV